MDKFFRDDNRKDKSINMDLPKNAELFEDFIFENSDEETSNEENSNEENSFSDVDKSIVYNSQNNNEIQQALNYNSSDEVSGDVFDMCNTFDCSNDIFTTNNFNNNHEATNLFTEIDYEINNAGVEKFDYSVHELFGSKDDDIFNLTSDAILANVDNTYENLITGACTHNNDEMNKEVAETVVESGIAGGLIFKELDKIEKNQCVVFRDNKNDVITSDELMDNSELMFNTGNFDMEDGVVYTGLSELNRVTTEDRGNYSSTLSDKMLTSNDEDSKQKEQDNALKIRKIVTRVLIAIQVICTVILNINLTKNNLLPLKYDILMIIAITLLNVLTWLSAKTKKMTIVMSILSTIVTTAIIVGNVTLVKVDKTVDSIVSNKDYEVVSISAIVPANSEIDDIKNIGGRTMGYMNYNQHMEELKKDIEKETSFPPQYTEYEGEASLVNALFQGTEEIMLMEEGSMDILRSTAGYEDIDTRIKVLHKFDVKIKKRKATSTQTAINKDIFVVYISGSDSREGLSKVALSDTNLLAVVNTKRRKIQLINTPRDYYVPIAGRGVEDKLTHAGIGGVTRSMETLENLYGVSVDYYFKISFEGFQALIDSLGGIEVYSPCQFTTYYTCITYPAGKQLLNGENALHFARERRAFLDGDIQRGKNQMEVIRGITNKMTSTELLKNFDGVMGSMAGCFETDIPTELMYHIVNKQLNKNAKWEVSTKCVEGYNDKVNEICIIRPKQQSIDEAKALINECISNQR